MFGECLGSAIRAFNNVLKMWWMLHSRFRFAICVQLGHHAVRARRPSEQVGRGHACLGLFQVASASSVAAQAQPWVRRPHNGAVMLACGEGGAAAHCRVQPAAQSSLNGWQGVLASWPSHGRH